MILECSWILNAVPICYVVLQILFHWKMKQLIRRCSKHARMLNRRFSCRSSHLSMFLIN